MDGGFPQPEHAIRYFAVIGAKEDTDAPAEAGQVLPVSILQRYPKEDSPDARFPPALASFCFPRGGAKVVPAEEETFDALHGFVLTNEAGTRCFGAALHLWCTHSSGLLVQKALAVVSKQPLWGAFRAFLCSLRATAAPERYIVNFVAETPLPPPGFVVSVALPQLPELALHRPAPNQLPLLDLPVRRMIQQLKPETMVSVVEALLIEQRIVLHSTCLSVVCAFCEILVGLIWPLRPAAVYVPLLPNALVDFCGAPLPFVLGIATEMVDRAEAICEPHTLFVNIDSSEVKVSQENSICTNLGPRERVQGPRPAVPERPHKKLLRRIDLALRGMDFQAEEQKHRFPLPLSRPASTGTPKQRSSSFGLAGNSSPATRPRMMSGVSDLGEVSVDLDLSRTPSVGRLRPSTDDAHSVDHVLARQGDASEGEQDSLIRMAFLWFMTDLLIEHSRFTNERFDGGFDQQGFLSRCSDTERPFLKEMTSTQMWASWISRRLDRSREDSTEVLLFDEVIAQKLNRKTFTLNKWATPFLSLDFSARMQEGGHYRVPDPPPSDVPGATGDFSTGADWRLDESRLYTPRPLPNLQAMLPTVSIPARDSEPRDSQSRILAKDPLHPQQTAPLQWFVQHCWLLTWAAYLPDRPECSALQWAKMDLCLAMLHKTGDDHRVEMPAPHDLSLSLLAAACARCGALRVDLARRLFAWMRSRQLGVATHPQSTSVFFEHFVQLCASDIHENTKVQEAVPKTGHQPVSHMNAGGRHFGGTDQQADLLLLEDLAARPRVLLQAVDGAPKATLVFNGQCTKCQGKLTLNEIYSQWSRPGAEETSAVQCPHCRKTATVQLRITADGQAPVEVDLLHPKRLALTLRGHLDARGADLGPAWLAGLASAPTLWTNLVWYFRSHMFFTEHLLTALGPDKVQTWAPEKAIELEGGLPSELPLSDTLQCNPGDVMNSFTSVHSHSRAPSINTAEAWEDLELDLPDAGINGAICASVLRRISKTSADSGLGGLGMDSLELRRRSLLFEVSRVEGMQMQREDLLGQLQRSEWQRQNEAAAAAARLSLIKVYSKVMEEIEPKKALVLESPPVQDEELARIVANAAVAKSTVGAVCRLLALKPPSPQEAPSSPTRTQWIQVKPALSESDVSDLRSPRPKQFQKCTPAWDLSSFATETAETEMTGPGQSLQSQTTVSGMDESPEAKRDERLDAKLNVSPVIGRHLDEKSPKHTEGHEDQEDVRLAERDGELAKLAKLEDLDPKLQEALIQLEALQAAGQKRCIFAAWRGLWAATVSGQGSAAPWSGGTGVDMEGSEEEACTLKTLEDFLQEADELEEKVRQSSKASLETFVDDATEEPTEGHRLGGAGAGAGEWKDSEEAEIQAARPPALEQAALCDEGAEVTAAEGTLKMVPRLHGSLHGLPLQSLDETPGPRAALPRRASSAPPERRNRGRRRKIVPLVISTGLATAPTSQIPSPNSVFPTPLLPRPTQAARRSKSSAR